jgi:hypothetical protein
MTWSSAVAWAAGLTFAGHSDWRLPFTAQPDPSCSSVDGYGENYGYNCTGSEMGHLGNVEGVSTGSPSPFFNIIIRWRERVLLVWHRGGP